MTTIEINLIKYHEEINNIAAYAKSIGFDCNSGNFQDLYDKWINHTKNLHDSIMANKEEVKRIVKSKI